MSPAKEPAPPRRLVARRLRQVQCALDLVQCEAALDRKTCDMELPRCSTRAPRLQPADEPAIDEVAKRVEIPCGPVLPLEPLVHVSGQLPVLRVAQKVQVAHGKAVSMQHPELPFGRRVADLDARHPSLRPQSLRPPVYAWRAMRSARHSGRLISQP